MSNRKLQQEMEKVFKKIDEGVTEFEALHEKIEQSTNPAQKEKLEDQLKREIKKLQRLRDQIKTWAASNDIKDKGPLLEKRKLIETQMEKFKAIEKAMKTKAYSKEGLAAAANLDPREQAKVEAGTFLGEMVDNLELQIEELEVSAEALAGAKRGKNNSSKQERLDDIEHKIERHKYHQGKLELIRRSLENGGIDTEQVKELEEDILYYVNNNNDGDFIENDYLYDDLNLEADEDAFGMHLSDEKPADTHSVTDEGPSPGEAIIESLKASSKPRGAEPSGKRQVSAQLKSPLPSLASLHPTASSSKEQMKPAPVPARPAGEGLKYASAAAAAAAADKNVGISPLPPPSGAAPARSSATSSPAISLSQSTSTNNESRQVEVPPPKATTTPSNKSTPQSTTSRVVKKAPSSSSMMPEAPSSQGAVSTPVTTSSKPQDSTTTTPSRETPASNTTSSITKGSRATSSSSAAPSQAPTWTASGSKASAATTAVSSTASAIAEEESIYHLPASLQDLLEPYELAHAQPMGASDPATLRMLEASNRDAPKTADSEPRKLYVPEIPVNISGSTYPTQPLGLLEHPRMYGRLETETLFYLFYYRQGSPQQYMAAKALKEQSWRFHKQYQTWFQRHEEPKSITEEYEQGTYRFFDYESTWMNRRKADFKFTYKFLEDEI